MYQKIRTKKQLFTMSMILTFIFYFFAHGYRSFNMMFSGDSLLMIYLDDSAWQIALGRFVQPFLILIRGGIAAPLLVAILSVIWMGASVYFLADFLKIERFISVVLIVVVMTCNLTITALNATYFHTADFYVFALFLAVFGVWLINRERIIFWILGTVSLSVSLGIYQAYICVAIGLVMIHFINAMLERPAFKDVLKRVLRYLFAFISAAVIYYLVWKIFQNVFNIWTSNSYNGLAGLGDYSDTPIVSLIVTTYRNVIDYFMHPETFATMAFGGVSLSIFWVYLIRLCNVAVWGILVVAIVVKNKKCKTNWWQRLVQILLIVLLPLGINFVCIISKGMEHSLMIYAFCLVYVFAIKAIESCLIYLPTAQKSNRHFVPWLAVWAAILVVSWSDIVYANQVYLKKELQERATQSLMTRIVYAIESAEGYVAGVTPVAISGSFENTSYVTDMEGFEDILPLGMGKSSLTYVGTDYAFLEYFLNVDMNLTRVDTDNETVKEMPVYPANGSVAFVDGVLVVKISE